MVRRWLQSRAGRRAEPAQAGAAGNPATPPHERLPPEALRYRVGGTADPAFFRSIGRFRRDSIVAAVADADRDFAACEAILDFGCGCGRTLLAFAERGPLDRFHATDTDAEAAGWCRANLPLASCGINDPLPRSPTPMARSIAPTPSRSSRTSTRCPSSCGWMNCGA